MPCGIQDNAVPIDVGANNIVNVAYAFTGNNLKWLRHALYFAQGSGKIAQHQFHICFDADLIQQGDEQNMFTRTRSGAARQNAFNAAIT